jgi:hypothetical protein
MRVLGFPVKVRVGFGVFMLLIVALNGLELGLWLAGSIAVFTLVHELGHHLRGFLAFGVALAAEIAVSAASRTDTASRLASIST